MIRGRIRRVLNLALRRRDRWEREVEDEIKLHLTLRAEQLAAEGRSATDAFEAAVQKFGPLEQSRARLLEAASRREQTMQRTEFFDTLRQDLGFALRTLGRQKAWTTVTVLTLALGIGATTAVFSVVSTLMLHPLPYPGAERIAFVDLQPTQGNNTGISVTISTSMNIVREWMKYSRGIEAIAGSSTEGKQLKTASGEPTNVEVQSVLPTWLDFAGVHPIIGRMFTPEDIASGRNPILLGEGFWRTRLGANPNVLGQTLTLNDSLFTIVGVAPEGLRFGGPAEAPTELWGALDVRNDKTGMSPMVRMRPGVTRAALAQELDSISRRILALSKLPFRTVVSAPSERVNFHDSLVTLAAAVGLVLLVACANVAHLILARSATRQREMAIRAALGAGRSRLLRQLLTESLVISLAGTACGTLLGWIGLKVMIALRPRSLDDLHAARLDGTTLALAIGAAIVSGAVFAAIGAVQAARHSTNESLKSGSLNASAGRRQGRGRALLVVSEMALSATLLVGATLLVRSVIALGSADLGFDPRGLYDVSPHFDETGFERAAWPALLAQLVDRARGLPGVTAVAVANVPPGGRWFSLGRLEIEGEPLPASASSSLIDINMVNPTFFRTMGINVREGRTSFSDTTAMSREIFVNEGFARKHWARGAAAGHRLRIAQTDSEPWLTIVGVVNDTKTSGPVATSAAPAFYSPATGKSAQPALLIRTSGGATSLASLPAIAQQLGIKRLAPPTAVAQTMARSIAGPRFIMLLLTTFTVLALLLAGVGLYGVMAYGVAERTREIGIRVALGASRSRVARRVVASGASLAGLGIVIGLGAATWGTRLIASELHGVAPLDPLSFAVGAAVLLATAVVACIVPARRALAVDPMTAIRAD